uniref:Uncharacterized protein n=1 Tax=Romanomermis culicivorax TaxID=13658 RepID=A0A915HQ67_ROMCU
MSSLRFLRRAKSNCKTSRWPWQDAKTTAADEEDFCFKQLESHGNYLQRCFYNHGWQFDAGTTFQKLFGDFEMLRRDGERQRCPSGDGCRFLVERIARDGAIDVGAGV